MSITLTLPVEFLENIDIVRVQANQLAQLQNRLDEANALNARISQQLAAAMAEIRSLRDQVNTSPRITPSSSPSLPPPRISITTSIAPSVVPKSSPIMIKASTSASSLRPKVTRSSVSEPQAKTIQPQSDGGIEPDTEWKQSLKKTIEVELRPMVNDAQDNYANKLKSLPANDSVIRQKASQEYNATMTTIRGLATEQYQTALERERQERKWASGIELSPEWTEALQKEQQSIMMKLAAERRQSLNRDSRSSASN
ncbi:hypothetical protein ONZ45_g17455 [Pleurotus djamor]|nr:hypothetical protein ONZ45_g17455 [Pleurotus djamor]